MALCGATHLSYGWKWEPGAPGFWPLGHRLLAPSCPQWAQRSTVRALCLQLCPILCHPMDCSPPGSSDYVTFPGENSGVGCHFLLHIRDFGGDQSFPHSSVGKESACSAGDPGSIPASGGSPGEGNGNPLQYSCLENPRQRSLAGSSPWGRKSQTRLSD